MTPCDLEQSFEPNATKRRGWDNVADVTEFRMAYFTR